MNLQDRENLIEQISRTICKSEGVDPDHHAIGFGNRFPAGQKYQLWEARRNTAVALLQDFEIRLKNTTDS